MTTNKNRLYLYVVVHHRWDQEQTWVNSWQDDERLEAITTTADIAGLCQEAKDLGKEVYVHRCVWGSNPHIVCCRALVAAASEIDRTSWLVMFTGQQALDERPPITPGHGQNSYLARAPISYP